MRCWEAIYVNERTIDFPIFLLFFNTKFPIFPIFWILSFLFPIFLSDQAAGHPVPDNFKFSNVDNSKQVPSIWQKYWVRCNAQKASLSIHARHLKLQIVSFSRCPRLLPLASNRSHFLPWRWACSHHYLSCWTPWPVDDTLLVFSKPRLSQSCDLHFGQLQ